MKSIKDFFTPEQIKEITSDLKFFGGKKLDTVKMNFGMETLSFVAQLEKAQNDKISNNPKGLMKSFDLLDSFYGMQVITWKHILTLRKELFGSDYVRKCCLYAIFRSYANDIDIVEELRNMVKDTKKLKHQKQKALK